MEDGVCTECKLEREKRSGGDVNKVRWAKKDKLWRNGLWESEDGAGMGTRRCGGAAVVSPTIT